MIKFDGPGYYDIDDTTTITVGGSSLPTVEKKIYIVGGYSLVQQEFCVQIWSWRYGYSFDSLNYL